MQKLSRGELAAFRDWFLGFDAVAWDKQFEEDVAAGHLDALADEAIRAIHGTSNGRRESRASVLECGGKR